MDFTAFRENVRKLVDSRGKTIKDVALENGMTPATISRYLNGSRSPEVECVVKLAEYFGVSVDWLLGRSENQFSVFPREVQLVAELYSVADYNDRKVIQAVLSKYTEDGKN